MVTTLHSPFSIRHLLVVQYLNASEESGRFAMPFFTCNTYFWDQTGFSLDAAELYCRAARVI
jgi:hypothetical protein